MLSKRASHLDIVERSSFAKPDPSAPTIAHQRPISRRFDQCIYKVTWLGVRVTNSQHQVACVKCKIRT